MAMMGAAGLLAGPDANADPPAAGGPSPRHRRRTRPAALTLPPGFKATLSAAEPDVVQPIAMALDPRGRLWVVENSRTRSGWAARTARTAS